MKFILAALRTAVVIFVVARMVPAGLVHAEEFVYVANFGSDNISAYRIDSSTGGLSQIVGAPFAAGVGPSAVAVDPTGRFAYVANSGSNDISAYRIDSSTGALSQIVAAPFAARPQPSAVAVDPTGKFAFVTNEADSSVSAFTINAATGALTPAPGSPFGTGPFPSSVAADATGRFAYAVNSGANVSAYVIHATTGALGLVAGSPFATGGFPRSVTLDPQGVFGYVTTGSGIAGYTIALNGVLTSVPAISYPRFGSFAIAVDPAGQFVYVTDSNSDEVLAYRLRPIIVCVTIPCPVGELFLLGIVQAGRAPLALAITGVRALPVAVDIKPRGNPNCINPTRNGLVSVAIYGGDALEAADIDPSTLRLGVFPPPAIHGVPVSPKFQCGLEDAPREGPTRVFSRDGIMDLVCKFEVDEVATWPAPGSDCGPVTLSGALRNGRRIVGTDTVCLSGEATCNAGLPIPLP